MSTRISFLWIGALLAVSTSFAFGQDASDNPAVKAFKEGKTARDDAYQAQIENYLRDWLVEQYPARAKKAWHRDYSGVMRFLASVEPNRRRWGKLLNPPAFQPTGELKVEPYAPLADLNAQWLTLPLGPIQAEGILVVPVSDKPVPLVITPHGLGGSPEGMFGLEQDQYYHAYARRLVDAGFAVFAPLDVCTMERRNRIERLCRLADTTLSGIELTRLQRLLDVLVKDPRIDGDRVGMWGLSLGGRATIYWTPLEPRIRVAIISAWFNRRPEKMVIPSDLYSCFLTCPEEHAFLRGWLTEFDDHDVVSLICPRPLAIQVGKKDTIAHWPHVVEDFAIARSHYEKLGLADRIELQLHEGAHETDVEPGIAFLERWLKQNSALTPKRGG